MLGLVIVLSLCIGLSLGLLGGGGSILTVPILRYVAGVEAHSAIALSLLVVAVTSLAGMLEHTRRRRVEFRIGLIFGAAGMVGAFAAGRVAHHVPATVLLVGFALMMVATAVAMLRPRRTPLEPPCVRSLPVIKILAEGLVVGAVTGLVGAGGGFLVVPALVVLGGLPMDLAIGTSLLVIAMKSTAGFIGSLEHTAIDWTLGTIVSIAASFGGFAGARLVGKIRPERLRELFGWFVVAMAILMLSQELPRLGGLSLAAVP